MATAQRVAEFLGRGGEGQALTLAGEHLPLVTLFVRAYTRGQGFDDAGNPNAELDAVIVTSCARMVSNPTSELREQLGDYSRVPHPPGWSLPEIGVLHRYRRRAA